MNIGLSSLILAAILGILWWISRRLSKTGNLKSLSRDYMHQDINEVLQRASKDSELPIPKISRRKLVLLQLCHFPILFFSIPFLGLLGVPPWGWTILIINYVSDDFWFRAYKPEIEFGSAYFRSLIKFIFMFLICALNTLLYK